MRSAFPADRTFFDLVAEGSPVSLAHALQHRTRPALRLLTRRALRRALRAPEELSEDVRARAVEELAFRCFLRPDRRLEGPSARGFLARAFPAGDPVHEAIARLPPPPGDRSGIGAHEEAWRLALAALAAARSRAAPAAARAAAALSFGFRTTVAPLVTSFRPRRSPLLLAGLVLRPALDLRVASDRPEDVVFRRDRLVGRTLRRAAARAQELAAEVTGDRRYFRLSLLEPPAPLALDGPSAGLAVFAASALALTHRNPPPPWIGFSGAFDEGGRLTGSGSPRAKVAAAAAGGLRALFLPEAARTALEGRRLPVEVVYLPPLAREALFERIEREIAELAPAFLRVREADARRIYARGESLFLEGRREAEAEFRFLVRALASRDETNALATLFPCAIARRGRCESRRGDVAATATSFDEAERRLENLVTARRLDREGREVLAELGVWKAINLIDVRDFGGALAAVGASLERKERDPYTTNHSLARSYGTRGIVRYSWARTLEDPSERERLFGEAEADLRANLERVQAFDRGRVRGYLATLDLYRGRAAEAAEAFRRVLAEERAEEGPRAVNPRWALDGLAHALHDLGRAGAGRTAFEEAIAVSLERVDVGIDQEISGRLLRWRGAALRELGRFDEARAALAESTAVLGDWPEGHPKNALAVAVWIERAILEGQAGASEAARDAARAALFMCGSFPAATLRAHFAPTARVIEAWLAAAAGGAALSTGTLVGALGWLLP